MDQLIVQPMVNPGLCSKRFDSSLAQWHRSRVTLFLAVPSQSQSVVEPSQYGVDPSQSGVEPS